MFWRIKRWWLRRMGQYPMPYIGAVSGGNALAWNDPALGRAETKALDAIEVSEWFCDPIGIEEAITEFEVTTGRQVLRYTINEFIDITEIHDVKRRTIPYRRLWYTPRPEEVAW